MTCEIKKQKCKKRTSEVPVRGPDDCNILITLYGGRADYIQDYYHKTISQALQKYPLFKPYFVPETLYYYGHDILNITLRKSQSSQFFPEKPPQLRVKARALTYNPGGPYQNDMDMEGS